MNARDLEGELTWLAGVLSRAFERYFSEDPARDATPEAPPPDLRGSDSPYARFVARHPMTTAERVALVLGLVPHIRPRLLDLFFTRNRTFDRRFTEFGGQRQGADGDFWPTFETLVFIVAGADLGARFALQAMFEPEHWFARHGVLRLDTTSGEPRTRAALRISEDHLELFTAGRPRRPDFGAGFPARFIETELTWDDLVLHPGTRAQIEDIETWLTHGPTLMHDWGMAPKLRPGHRSLFYGPPGTGKTMTACLLGKSTGRDVYKIDLSLVVSKYIGETEKNLARVFEQAQSKGWILFFDEAEALFGKRSETRDAHDRYANQEVSFLLQRIEVFDGVAILASNRRDDMDDAFARRFESMIYFPVPSAEQRYALWQRGFSARSHPPPPVELRRIAERHELSGGAIMNVIRHASLQALKRKSSTIAGEDLVSGIEREHAKEGRR